MASSWWCSSPSATFTVAAITTTTTRQHSHTSQFFIQTLPFPPSSFPRSTLRLRVPCSNKTSFETDSPDAAVDCVGTGQDVECRVGNWWNFPAVHILQNSPKITARTKKKVVPEKPVVVELKNTELPKPKQKCLMLKLNYDDQTELSLKIISRRRSVGAITCLILGGEGILRTQIANAFELKFVAPDRTVEEALGEVRDHAKDLLQVRDLLELESWKSAQKALRLSSALLKKDIYIIIQSKPGIERSQLRKLYSTLFNNVTRLDYAARDKDGPQVWQCYENIVVAVNDILSRI